MLLCGMNFINLTHIQFIFGIEDQLILSYNPRKGKKENIPAAGSECFSFVADKSFLCGGSFLTGGFLFLVISSSIPYTSFMV